MSDLYGMLKSYSQPCLGVKAWHSSSSTGMSLPMFQNFPERHEEENEGRIWPIIAVILTKLLKLITLLAFYLDWTRVHGDLEIRLQE